MKSGIICVETTLEATDSDPVEIAGGLTSPVPEELPEESGGNLELVYFKICEDSAWNPC